MMKVAGEPQAITNYKHLKNLQSEKMLSHPTAQNIAQNVKFFLSGDIVHGF